jgi:hypothetical protein
MYVPVHGISDICIVCRIGKAKASMTLRSRRASTYSYLHICCPPPAKRKRQNRQKCVAYKQRRLGGARRDTRTPVGVRHAERR